MKPTEDPDDLLPVVPFCPFRCPRCQAPKPFTYGRKGRVRYHRCQECKTRFRSLELRRDQLATFDPPAVRSAPLNQPRHIG